MTDETPKTHSVLLLEDDPHFQAVVRDILEGSGVEAKVVSCVEEAKKLFAEEDYEVLLVDGLLPDGMGIDFIRWVRASQPEIPIIYVSGFFRDAVTYQTLKYELRVNKILPKPITSELLAEEIAGVMIESGLGHLPIRNSGPETSEENHEAFEQALQERTRDFEAALLQRIDDIRASIEAARSNVANEIFLIEAIRLVHSLAGTAGSFGHHKISSALSIVERVLRTSADDPTHFRQEHWELVVIVVDQLKRIHVLAHPEAPESH